MKGQNMQTVAADLSAVAVAFSTLAPAFHALEELATNIEADIAAKATKEAPPIDWDAIRANQRRMLHEAALRDIETAKRWAAR